MPQKCKFVYISTNVYNDSIGNKSENDLPIQQQGQIYAVCFISKDLAYLIILWENRADNVNFALFILSV